MEVYFMTHVEKVRVGLVLILNMFVLTAQVNEFLAFFSSVDLNRRPEENEQNKEQTSPYYFCTDRQPRHISLPNSRQEWRKY